MSLDTFTDAYIECALWAETASGVPEDDGEGTFDTSFESYGFSACDIAPESLESIKADCADFYNANSHLFEDDRIAGHDFWLTRCGHGAGFWDGDYPEHGDTLTKASKVYGQCDLYVGDDGLIHVT